MDAILAACPGVDEVIDEPRHPQDQYCNSPFQTIVADDQAFDMLLGKTVGNLTFGHI